MYENMGQTIAKLRRDRNLTQEKLAEQLAVSAQFDRYRSFTQNSIRAYTSPLLRLVPYENAGQRADDETPPQTEKRSLADDWPWWSVPGNGAVRAEMEADPRWQTWVDSLV